MAEQTFDVCIVGAGPAGSTCAFYLAQNKVRVLLLDRERFPRDKLCGDAVCSPAHVHLRRMGVLQEIEAEGLGNWAAVGGLFSPKGIGYIGCSVDVNRSPLVIAIRRIVLDEKMVRAAVKAGANLVEEFPVGSVEFSPAEKLWTIRHFQNAAPPFRARALVAADGAQSRLARSLGIVNTRPDAICSRNYIESATTNFDADGVVYYPPELVPGYCALFREACGLINFCCYIIPGGRCGVTDLKRMHEHLLQNYGELRKALGDNARIQKMRGASLRLGGVERSSADHDLVIGDAAGQTDPLTGEGIHTSIEAAAIAADVLTQAFRANDLSARFLERYHSRWRAAFGNDFRWSARMARISARYPSLLDGAAALLRNRGADFLREWGELMTGVKPKSGFLRPGFALPLFRELARQWIA